ncbi:MAG: phasin family protein [Xanthobacteraceae bacterium]
MIDQMTKQTETAFNTFKAAFAPFADAFKNVQTADVPEAARDFVKRAIDTAKERAADAHAGAEKVTAVIEDAAVGAVSETVKLSRNVQQAFYEDAEAFFTGIDKLASAKTFADALQIQSDYLRSRGEVAVARARSASEYAGKLFAEGAKTAQDNLAKVAATVGKAA